jgi:hypothetical protein
MESRGFATSLAKCRPGFGELQTRTSGSLPSLHTPPKRQAESPIHTKHVISLIVLDLFVPLLVKLPQDSLSYPSLSMYPENKT